MKSLSLAYLVGSYSTLFVLFGLVFASLDDFGNVSQMKSRGFKKGLPFLCHGGMWGDFFIISLVLGLVTYFCKWDGREWLIALALGSVASTLMHLSYLKTNIPEAHTHGHFLTPAGFIHLMYMAFALAMIGLFYFRTPQGIPPALLIGISVALVIHLLAGTHIVLGAINRFAHFDWVAKDYLRDKGAWVTVVAVSAILSWRCYYILKTV